jgi:hypothetical protein
MRPAAGLFASSEARIVRAGVQRVRVTRATLPVREGGPLYLLEAWSVLRPAQHAYLRVMRDAEGWWELVVASSSKVAGVLICMVFLPLGWGPGDTRDDSRMVSGLPF